MAFQKGYSGNPNGRPKKGNTFTDVLEKVLQERTGEIETAEGKKIVNGKELLANVLYDIAADVNNAPKLRLDAINTIMNRLDGKPMQQTAEPEDNRRTNYSTYMMSAEERMAEFRKLMGYTDEETEDEKTEQTNADRYPYLLTTREERAEAMEKILLAAKRGDSKESFVENV